MIRNASPPTHPVHLAQRLHLALIGDQRPQDSHLPAVLVVQQGAQRLHGVWGVYAAPDGLRT